MKRFVLLVAVLLLIAPSAFAQSYRWAVPVVEPPASRVMSLATDSNGNIYSLVTIRKGTSSLLGVYPCGDLVLEKRNGSGVSLWTRQLVGTACGMDLAVDSSLHIIMTGSFFRSLKIGDTTFGADSLTSGMFIAKFSPDGSLDWAQADTSGHDISGGRMGYSLAADAADNIYLTGMSNDVLSFCDKLTPDGHTTWIKEIDGVRTFDDVAVSPSGEVFVSGTCESHSKFDSFSLPDSAAAAGYVTFAAGLDPNGTTRWLRAEPFGTFTLANCIGYTPGRLYRYRYANGFSIRSLDVIDPITGGLDSTMTVDMGWTPVEQFISNTLSTDAHSASAFIFDARRDTAIILWARPLISTHGIFEAVTPIDTIAAAGISAQAITRSVNQLYISGAFGAKSVSFGKLVVPNQHDVSKFEDGLYLANYDPFETTLRVSSSDDAPSVELYPNPCSDALCVRLAKGESAGASAVVYSMLGEQVMTWDHLPPSGMLFVGSLPSGSYEFVLTTAAGKRSRLFIKQ
jgi:hypothetical protein